ncbi:MAG: DUF1566 domain-containing protein [Desulfobacterales bacterium]
MERENFYILLELPCDPPETNPEVIEKAISKKQSEWSRLRNHPTKGLHAQKYINMIPEIRRVMQDEALRAKEAEAAKRLLAKDKESKHPEIDRHIDILMGKGHITPEEKAKLTRVHGFRESEIQDRINARKNASYHRIDQQITLRMAKGYLTESEIEKIAKRNSAKVEDVRSRVRCPIQKTDKDPETPKPRQLDRSLEKTIRDNLKLLNKSSLYDFLELPESADLKSLQNAAVRKKKELTHSSKKDAVATATSTLAGHCITIFKSEQSRTAYDISLAKTKLSELDSDIEIAGINGKLRPEYFEILVGKAMDFGMERDEAEKYIKAYCRRKNWTVEAAPEKRRKYLLAAAVAAGLVVVLAAAGIIYYIHHQQQIRQSEYEQMIEQVRDKDAPEAKIDELQAFINNHGNDGGYEKYIAQARNRIAEINDSMAENQYRDFSAAVKDLAETGKHQAAIDKCRQYLAQNPPEKYANKAESQINELENRIEKQDFEQLKQLMIDAPAPEKIEAIAEYREKYPEGAYLDQVDEMLSEISGEYYIFVKNELETCEKKQNWQRCAELCESYISRYDNAYADKLQNRLAGYQKKIKQDRVFTALRRKAKNFGTDYAAAIKMYKDHLSAYPDTPIAGRIQSEIEELEQKQREKTIAEAGQQFRDLLAQTGKRYEENPEGVVRDTKTGLMWQLLDTTLTRPEKCMTYEKAREYVKNLSTGGYTDWRLPTADELAGIYKNDPFFPAMEEKWYWSSETYSSYDDGWQKIVATVSNTQGGSRQTKRRDSRECGAVRAVRD